MIDTWGMTIYNILYTRASQSPGPRSASGPKRQVNPDLVHKSSVINKKPYETQKKAKNTVVLLLHEAPKNGPNVLLLSCIGSFDL